MERQIGLCDNISVKDGVLYFAGQNTVELAEKYGTPLYLLDEDKIREKCRIYKAAFKKHFGPGSVPLYASKANSFKHIYRIMAEEEMCIDVVSSGEIFTAKSAGFDLSKAYFHGNAKTDKDIAYAMDCGVGYFVLDNMEEIEAVNEEAKSRGIVQKALLRVTPGIDPHTYEAIATGKIDSQFGIAIGTGQAEKVAIEISKCENIELLGYHCHVGSQVFAEDVFERAAVAMVEFTAKMEREHGIKAKEIDLGGGYGVRYMEDDPYLDIEKKVAEVASAAKDACAKCGIALPEIHMEPGRSIVADAGMTLYTVSSVKEIPGYKNYVAIDGSMADHIRYALYGAQYTCFAAGKADDVKDFACTIVGRCCESGDIIAKDIAMPKSIKRGDIVAVCTTGAYHYSMASNYNRLPKPPIVMLRGGESYVAVERESFEDLVRNER